MPPHGGQPQITGQQVHADQSAQQNASLFPPENTGQDTTSFLSDFGGDSHDMLSDFDFASFLNTDEGSGGNFDTNGGFGSTDHGLEATGE